MCQPNQIVFPLQLEVPFSKGYLVKRTLQQQFQLFLLEFRIQPLCCSILAASGNASGLAFGSCTPLEACVLQVHLAVK